jgi:hypothetical protein
MAAPHCLLKGTSDGHIQPAWRSKSAVLSLASAADPDLVVLVLMHEHPAEIPFLRQPNGRTIPGDILDNSSSYGNFLAADLYGHPQQGAPVIDQSNSIFVRVWIPRSSPQQGRCLVIFRSLNGAGNLAYNTK